MISWQKFLLTASLYATFLAVISFMLPVSTKRIPASALQSSTCAEAMDYLLVGSSVLYRQQMKLILKEIPHHPRPLKLQHWLQQWQELATKSEVSQGDVDRLIAALIKLQHPKLTSLFERDFNLTLRLYREELFQRSLRSGLYGALTELGIQITPAHWKRFWNGRLGEALKVSFGSLGVFWGLPPLYLPKLNLELMHPNLESKLFRSALHYHYWREHYMVFAGLASTMISAYWFYADYEALNTESAELDHYEMSALELLESVKVSNERLLDQGICRFVTDCTDSQGVGPQSGEYLDYYLSCREVLGPDFSNCSP